MSESLSRAFVSDIEVRSDGEGRTVHGIIVPFDQVALVSDGGRPYKEAFQRGAFAKTIIERGNRIPLLSHHDSRRNPLGKASLLREDAAGLYGEFLVSRTRAGDEALELIRDGALDSFSVGFKGIQHAMRDGVKWRTEAGLRETSVVTFPAYEGALVGGVRMYDDLEDLVSRLREAGYELPPTSHISDPEAIGTPTGAAAVVEDPALAPVRTALTFQHLRRMAREKGVL